MDRSRACPSSATMASSACTKEDLCAKRKSTIIGIGGSKSRRAGDNSAADYSADRFIPTRLHVSPGQYESTSCSRVSSGLQASLLLPSLCASPECTHEYCEPRWHVSTNPDAGSSSNAKWNLDDRRSRGNTSVGSQEQTYAQMLRAELLGLHHGGVSPGSPSAVRARKECGKSLATLESHRKPSTYSSLLTHSPSIEPLRVLNFSPTKAKVQNSGASFLARQRSWNFTRSPSISLSSSDTLGSESTHDSSSRTVRRIAQTPYKVLDAPQLADDWYRNVLDWSKRNVLSVALGSSLYLYYCNEASTSKQRSVVRLLDLCPCCNYVTSCSWSQDGEKLAVGTHQGNVFVFDVETKKVIRDFQGHLNDVHALAWNGDTLCTGCDDGILLQRDIRGRKQFSSFIRAHGSRICSFKVSHDGRHLASGGNDNMVCIWDMGRSDKPVHRFSEHTAAVKAMAWSPQRSGLLATGGGSTDRSLRFWNTNMGVSVGSLDTGSQICNLAWSLSTNELVTTHGYSGNEIMVWKYPTLKKVAALTGHTSRVLQLAVSPEGSSIVTGAGDETLRFWNIWPSARNLHHIKSERTWHSVIR